MSVRFIVGRAGSGKSMHCFRAIVEAMRGNPLGRPIYWVVPKQQTFSAERELTCLSGLAGFCRARVVSFDLLVREILAECGGTAVPEVTSLGRQMIIGHLLRKHQDELRYYRSSARHVGLAAELDATFCELERCGKSAGDLTALVSELDDATPGASLINKLSDLRLLYERYLAYLGNERLDPHRRVETVLSSLPDCRKLRGATVFVDGFVELHEWELRMLAGMAQVCEQLHITMLLDPASPILKDPHRLPDDLSPFHRTERTYRRLWFTFSEAEIPVEPPLRLQETPRFKTPSLRLIEQHLFAPRPVIAQSAEHLKLIEAPDRRGEVDAAAREIRSLLKDGLRLREITVLMRSVGDYQELVDAGFREHGIAHFMDWRRTAAHHPLVQLARAALQVSQHDWQHDAMMSLLKSALAGVTLDEADSLENYVLTHRIRGGIWADESPWTYQRRLTRGDADEMPETERVEVERIDTTRRSIATSLLPLVQLLRGDQVVTVRQIVVELFNTFERFDVRGTLARWIEEASAAGHAEEAEEHQQVWSELVQLLDEMVDLIGDEAVTPEVFVDILETGLEQFDLALIPPTVDQVIVGSVDRTHSIRPRAVILLGMNDTQFPRPPREGSILSDNERRTMQRHRVELDPDGERTLLDEQLLGYVALTRASERLCLVRSIADDENRPQAPSMFWTRLRQQFPSLTPIQIPRESRSLLDCIGTPRQLVTALMHWARKKDDLGRMKDQGEQTEGARQNDQGRLARSSSCSSLSLVPSSFPHLYQWLATRACNGDAIDIMRYRSWKALSYANEAVLSDMTATRLFSSPLRAGVSQIETFAACPFRHYARYGLRLSEREEQDVTAIDLGLACHGILEKLVRNMLPDKKAWDSLPPEKSKPLIHELANEIGQELRGELMLSTARNQYILQRIETTIQQVLAAQSAAGRRGQFIPWQAELEFGDGKTVPSLELHTPAGNLLRLRGKIDRVDRIEGGKQVAFAVIDYKYRGDRLGLDRVYHGLSLQLLTYLLVLQRSKIGGTTLTPAAAFYVQLLRQLEKVDYPEDGIPPEDPAFDLKCKPRGLINWEYRHSLDQQHTAGSSEVYSIFETREGALGKGNSTDAAAHLEFVAMLKLVERKLAELADQIIAGQIGVSPYRIAQSSPCTFCEYRAVCRFDATVNQYHHLSPMKREDVLRRAVEETGSSNEEDA